MVISKRDIFGRGLMIKSYTFILVHNHPSGKAEPSSEDKEVMDKLKKGAKELDVTLLDFIIVGEDKYWSMFEEADGGEYSLGSVWL